MWGVAKDQVKRISDGSVSFPVRRLSDQKLCSNEGEVTVVVARLVKCKAGFEHCGVVVCRQTMEGPLSRAKEERAFLAYLTHFKIDRFTERKLLRRKVISGSREGADGEAACRSDYGSRDWPGRDEMVMCACDKRVNAQAGCQQLQGP